MREAPPHPALGTHDLILCGWRVRSELPLPELVPWPGAADASVDLIVREAPVASQLVNPAMAGHCRSVGADGSVLLHIEGLVRILVSGGTSITVEILGERTDPGWRLFLLGAAVVFVCHQRGVFPLHAATLQIDGRTLAIAGHSGAGKSTLAMALARRGHTLLSDDLTVLTFTADAATIVLPAFPRLKLWHDTLDALAIKTTNLQRVRDALPKYDLRPCEGFDPSPARLDGIITLVEKAETRLIARSRAEAIPEVRGYVARPQVAVHLGRSAGLFAQAAMIAKSVPVYQLERPKQFASLAETVALIEDHCAS